MEKELSIAFSRLKNEAASTFTRDENVINFLKRMDKITLTGSRHFGTATANSDWDFFVSAENRMTELVTELQNLGFEEEEKSVDNIYDDPSINKVLSYCSGGIKIHIQIISTDQWYNRKVRAQVIIDALFDIMTCYTINGINAINKRGMKRIWKDVLSDEKLLGSY